MNKVAQGAEAVISVEDGSIIKERIDKGYRHEVLDKKLRKDRTDLERRLMEKAAKAGVKVPEIRDSSDFSLEMERIEGEKLREVLEDRLELCREIGESIARLHSSDIIHGDLTTSNMMLKDDEVYFIDFGLGFFSQRVEDRATDLRLLWQVLESTHFGIAEEAFERIIEAYSQNYDCSEEVLDRLEDIDARGRYL